MVRSFYSDSFLLLLGTPLGRVGFVFFFFFFVWGVSGSCFLGSLFFFFFFYIRSYTPGPLFPSEGVGSPLDSFSIELGGLSQYGGLAGDPLFLTLPPSGAFALLLLRIAYRAQLSWIGDAEPFRLFPCQFPLECRPRVTSFSSPFF